jgi:glycosyltransferase involved in cell wall biosynthesis
MKNDIRPFVSVLVFNYFQNELENLIQSVFTQTVIRDVEVVLCAENDSGDDWRIANDYMEKYNGRVTIFRQRKNFGPEANKAVGRNLMSGQYSVLLTEDRKFDADYVKEVIRSLESDPLFMHSYIAKSTSGYRFMAERRGENEPPLPELHRTVNPLVSVCVYNYNYGPYLEDCLQSVAAQTYRNVEICFSDNASTDESWRIACRFAEKYPDKIGMIRNRKNFGPGYNLRNTELLARGKYIIKLTSDDIMKPEFIEKCVAGLEQCSDAAFAMVHRDIIDEHGNVSTEPPFYDRSCLIKGEDQTAVYMMATINPSISQILYKREKIEAKRMVGNLNDRWFGDRLMDFHVCCESPVIYIKDALLINRVHSKSDGSLIDDNLMQGIGQYVLIHQLSDIAGGYKNDKATGRLGEAVAKHAKLCMRYCLRFLLKGNERTALRYYHLGLAIDPGLAGDATLADIENYWTVGSAEKAVLLDRLGKQQNLVAREISYAPPEGSLTIDI